MAWELRGGLRYYYRRVRVNGRQVRRYVGRGPLAEVASAADLALRRRRELTREERRGDQARWRAADAALLPLLRSSDLLLRAALGKAGYRQHQRGEWRRWRRAGGEGAMDVAAVGQGRRAGEVVAAQEVLRRASQGDRSVLAELAALLDRHPEVWSRAGDLAAQALQAWVNLAAGEDLLLRESLGRRLEGLRGELLTPAPSALERILVGRVIACHLQVEYADALAAQARPAGPASQRLNMDRQDSAQRRLLAADKALALCRRLLPAAAPVVDHADEDRRGEPAGPALVVRGQHAG